MKFRVAPRAGAVIDVDRFVRFGVAIERFGRGELDFAERHLNVGVDFAGDIDLRRIWQRLAALRLERGLARNHNAFLWPSAGFLGRNGEAPIPSPALPGSGSAGLSESLQDTLSLRAANMAPVGSPVTTCTLVPAGKLVKESDAQQCPV